MKTEKLHAKIQGWAAVVLYEDTVSREAAVRFCDRLVERFWPSREFEIHWASFSTLNEQSAAFADKAARADVLIFATPAGGTMPEETVAWIENSLATRGDHEGALVGLLHDFQGIHTEPASWQKHAYLRNLAHRLSMDYWTDIPQHLSRTIPDSLDSYSDRADRVTHVLDEILHQNVLPPGLHN